MLRLLFSKSGNAVWISHLDTMRLFQRAFKRSGLHLKHTQGFNPRPSVSIALPLSVGVESICELLDFELEDTEITAIEIQEKLNANLVDGIQVLDVYDQGAKLKFLKYLQCELDLEYDHGIHDEQTTAISQLFNQAELWMDKKSKNGITSRNIIPMIQSINITPFSNTTLRICAIISCQEPSLNPTQLSAAVIKYLPQYTPDHVRCRRCELFNTENQIFR
jgi:radical SAM-linked protein